MISDALFGIMVNVGGVTQNSGTLANVAFFSVK